MRKLENTSWDWWPTHSKAYPNSKCISGGLFCVHWEKCLLNGLTSKQERSQEKVKTHVRFHINNPQAAACLWQNPSPKGRSVGSLHIHHNWVIPMRSPKNPRPSSRAWDRYTLPRPSLRCSYPGFPKESGRYLVENEIWISWYHGRSITF